MALKPSSDRKARFVVVQLGRKYNSKYEYNTNLKWPPNAQLIAVADESIPKNINTYPTMIITVGKAESDAELKYQMLNPIENHFLLSKALLYSHYCYIFVADNAGQFVILCWEATTSIIGIGFFRSLEVL